MPNAWPRNRTAPLTVDHDQVGTFSGLGIDGVFLVFSTRPQQLDPDIAFSIDRKVFVTCSLQQGRERSSRSSSTLIS